MRTAFLKHLLLATILSGTTNLPSQEFPRFSQKILHLDGEVLDVFQEDLNGDAASDILVLHNRSRFPEPHVDRLISIFLQNSGHFLDQPSQTLTADQGEILFDTGDIDGDTFPELVFLREDGIYARKYNGVHYSQTLHTVLKTPSVFLSHDPSKLRRYPFIRDLDSNTVPELLIFQPHQLHIYSQSPAGDYTLTRKLWVSPDFTLSTRADLTFSLHLPSLHLQDFNGDSIFDLLLISGDRLDVYLQHSSTTRNPYPSLTPPTLRYRMGFRLLTPSVLEPLAPPSITLNIRDLNHDGFVDLLLSKASRASFTTNISQVQVYLNKRGIFEHLPDQVLTTENFGGEYIVRDFNQDNLLDLALFTFKIGFAQAAKFLITKKASNTFEFYLMCQNGTYPTKPDGKVSFSRKVRIGDILGSRLCHSFDGDFNGDGIQDLLIGTNTNELSIFPGHSQGLFSKKATHKIRAPISTHLCIEDLNRDGFSDILLWYPQNPARCQQVLLIQSERKVSP